MTRSKSRGSHLYVFSWRAVLSNVAIAIAILILGFIFGGTFGVFTTAVCVILYRRVARRIFIPDFVAAFARAKHDDYDGVIEGMQRCEQSLARRPWIDRWRVPLLSWQSPWPVRIHCLWSIANCHLKMNRVEQAKQTYQAILEIEPDFEYASDTLETISTIEANTLSNLPTNPAS